VKVPKDVPAELNFSRVLEPSLVTQTFPDWSIATLRGDVPVVKVPKDVPADKNPTVAAPTPVGLVTDIPLPAVIDDTKSPDKDVLGTADRLIVTAPVLAEGVTPSVPAIDNTPVLSTVAAPGLVGLVTLIPEPAVIDVTIGEPA
jgi:hypothetical protein